MTIKEIETLIQEGRLGDAYDALSLFLATQPGNARGWFLLGNIYRVKQQWCEAVAAYNKAKMIDPEGPADAAIESIFNVARYADADLLEH